MRLRDVFSSGRPMRRESLHVAGGLFPADIWFRVIDKRWTAVRDGVEVLSLVWAPSQDDRDAGDWVTLP